MRIKLSREVNGTPAMSVVDADEAEAKRLIGDGSAVEFSQAVEDDERKAVVKQLAKEKPVIKTANRGTAKMELKALIEKVRNDEPLYVGKAFQRLAGKAVTGMSEGTAADGGALIATAVSEIMGIALQGSQVYSLCRKLTLPPGCNSIVVPVDASDPFIKANAPVPTNPAEGAQKTATKLAFSPRTLTLGKTVLYIPVTDELLADAATLDGYIRQYAFSKLGGTLDYEVLAGGSGGHAALIGDTGYVATQSISSTPTLAECQGVVSKVDPRLQAGSKWFMSIGLWNSMVSAFGTAANIQSQLIDIKGKELLGYPVQTMACLNAQLVFGNFAHYTVAEPRVNDVVAVSEDIRFDYDETVYRLVHRSAGAAAWKARTSADSLAIAAFCQKA